MARALLSNLLHALSLALGVADELASRADKPSCLAELSRKLGLYFLQEIKRLIALDNAALRAERKSPGILDHIVEHIDELLHSGGVLFHFCMTIPFANSEGTKQP